MRPINVESVASIGIWLSRSEISWEGANDPGPPLRPSADIPAERPGSAYCSYCLSACTWLRTLSSRSVLSCLDNKQSLRSSRCLSNLHARPNFREPSSSRSPEVDGTPPSVSNAVYSSGVRRKVGICVPGSHPTITDIHPVSDTNHRGVKFSIAGQRSHQRRVGIYIHSAWEASPYGNSLSFRAHRDTQVDSKSSDTDPSRIQNPRSRTYFLFGPPDTST